jgi:hypothetical protein
MNLQEEVRRVAALMLMQTSHPQSDKPTVFFVGLSVRRLES